MQQMNNLFWDQQCNRYGIFLENGFEIMEYLLPNDGNFIKDYQVLKIITQALYVRMSHSGCEKLANQTFMNQRIVNGILVEQCNNRYSLFDSFDNKTQISQITLPPDGAYAADYKILELITKAIALRFGLKKGTNKKSNQYQGSNNCQNKTKQ